MCGEVPELADGRGLGPRAERRGGSSPPFPTIYKIYATPADSVFKNSLDYLATKTHQYVWQQLVLPLDINQPGITTTLAHRC